jgi:rod shape-determining protein MreD
MISDIVRYGINTVLLVLIQVLVLNNINLFGYLTPYLYVLALIVLPVESNRNLVLLFSFVLGLSIDLFTGTWGMHTSACVLLGFLRPYALKLLAPRDGYEFGSSPDLSTMGISWFVTYAGVLILSHHVFLFFVEVFRLSEILPTLARSISTAIFTAAVVILTQFLTYRRVRST